MAVVEQRALEALGMFSSVEAGGLGEKTRAAREETRSSSVLVLPLVRKDGGRCVALVG
jgi:hypothetical protein